MGFTPGVLFCALPGQGAGSGFTGRGRSLCFARGRRIDIRRLRERTGSIRRTGARPATGRRCDAVGPLISLGPIFGDIKILGVGESATVGSSVFMIGVTHRFFVGLPWVLSD